YRLRRSIPRLYAPLSTLRRHPRGYLRMTRGRCGSLVLHRNGLAPSTSCRPSRRSAAHDFCHSWRLAIEARTARGPAGNCRYIQIEDAQLIAEQISTRLDLRVHPAPAISAPISDTI